MTLRHLQITWSLFCSTAVLLLIALAVRSYWRADIATGIIAPTTVFTVVSDSGRLLLTVNHDAPNPRTETWQWHHSYAPGPSTGDSWTSGNLTAGWFVGVPQLFPISLAAAIAAMPWFVSTSRFSIRTLLVATTLVAAALGVLTLAIK